MATKTYTVKLKSGGTIKFSTDFAQSNSPIILIDDEGVEHATRFNVSNFYGDNEYAAEMLVQDAGEDFWLEPEAEETEDEHGISLYDGVTADLYVAAQIHSITIT